MVNEGRERVEETSLVVMSWMMMMIHVIIS